VPPGDGPSSLQRAEPSASLPWMTRLARAALAVRHTRLGRALYRLAPQPWVNALKNRLSA
jgi:hypothetical protein